MTEEAGALVDPPARIDAEAVVVAEFARPQHLERIGLEAGAQDRVVQPDLDPERALTGRVQAHQRFLLSQQLAHIDFLDEQEAQLEEAIDQLLTLMSQPPEPPEGADSGSKPDAPDSTFQCDGTAAEYTITRRFYGFLDIHIEVDKIDGDLNMSLWLHVTAHYTKTHIGFPILCNKGRNDGMERPFPRCKTIIMPCFQAEQFSPVL